MSDRTDTSCNDALRSDERVTTIRNAASKDRMSAESRDALDKALVSLAADAAETASLREENERRRKALDFLHNRILFGEIVAEYVGRIESEIALAGREGSDDAYREGDKCDGCRRWWFASGAWHLHNPRSVTHCVRSVTCPECEAGGRQR